MEEKFHDILKHKIHEFVMYSYALLQQFPETEKYGIRSQLSRAAMSIMLNYVEGFARRRDKVKLNFYETAHGSTQECKYILYFSFCQKWISPPEYQQATNLLEQIARMLWSTIDGLERKINN